MNPKEIAEELIVKMINAAARKQTSAWASASPTSYSSITRA